MKDAREELVLVLRDARALLSQAGNNFVWSGWDDAAEALAELDRLIESIERGKRPSRTAVWVLFAATGPIQEVSLSSGWHDEYMALASRYDEVQARAWG